MDNTINANHCPRCGAPIPPEAPQGLCPKCVFEGAATSEEAQEPLASATGEIPSLERVAKAFPQLEILELVGRGGMGFVFKARQPHLDRFVALKLLPDKLARDPRFAERFNREGRVLARLNHPNIVAVYDFGQAEDFFFLLMEYVDGVNLRQAMQAGRFSPSESLAIVPRICEALQYAHSQGILHRDIKPANILLDTRGQVKIADFGIAKLVGEDKPDVTLTATGAALGTPQYMAPEQLEKPAEVDHRADIYSLGVVFYEMLTGELPIGRFAPPSSKTPVDASVDEVVFRTLEKDRERRFQSAGEMKTQVEHLGIGAATIRQRADSPGFSHWSIYGAGLVGLSLPVPLLCLFVTIVERGRVGIGAGELWLSLASIALPGIGGTLLGWLGLNEIRESGGRVRGLPLALFATLTWPLVLVASLGVGAPLLFLTRPRDAMAGLTLARLLVLLVPAAVITFEFWLIYTTARWAQKRPEEGRRSLLKWLFAGVLVAAFGAELVLAPFRARVVTQPVSEAAAPPAPAAEPSPIRANFRVGKGQVVILEMLRRDVDPPSPVPFYQGYVIAPDEERGRFSLVLTPTQPWAGQTNAPAWRLTLVSDDGATVSGGVQDFGELVPNLPPDQVHAIEPNSDAELPFTRPDPQSGPAEPRRLELSLRLRSQARGEVGRPRESVSVSIGSTNWVDSLRQEQTANP